MFPKVILFITSITLVLLAFFSYTKEEKIQIKAEVLEEKNIVQNKTSRQNNQNTNPRKHQKKDVSSSQATITSATSLYQSLSIEEVALHHKPRSYVKAIAAIAIAKKSIAVGDTLILANIEGIDYEIFISDVAKNEDGSQSITGAYSDEGIAYTTTITQAENESFISLATAQGAYEIETQDTLGYIYRTQDIRKAMQPSPKNDEIILPLPSNLRE